MKVVLLLLLAFPSTNIAATLKNDSLESFSGLNAFKFIDVKDVKSCECVRFDYLFGNDWLPIDTLMDNRIEGEHEEGPGGNLYDAGKCPTGEVWSGNKCAKNIATK